MDVKCRLASIQRLDPGVRLELLKFMETCPQAALATDVPSTRCLLSRRSPEIWKVRRGEQTRYKARLNLNSLRLWTTEQTERSVAAQHLSILKHMRDTVAAASAAASQFWADTDVVHQTCQGVLRAHQTSERELGLSACVLLRATRWLGSTRVTSPAMSLGGALQAHARLVLA